MSRRGNSHHTRDERAHANRIGIFEMIGAMACFVVNDTLIKYVAQSLPGAELVFVRGVVASVLVLLLAWRMGALPHLREIFRGWVAIRASVDAIATAMFLLALFNLPISAATSINMTGPLMITMLAPLFLGPQRRPPPWLATIIGFGGVLMIVQPKAGAFNGYAFLCLAGTFLASIRDLLTPRIHARVPSILVTLSTMLAVTTLAGLLSPIQGWVPIPLGDLVRIALSAVFLSAGYFLIISAMRTGDVAIVAPFRYSALIFALFTGYMVWSEWPNALAWIGVMLVVGSGMYVLRVGRRTPAASSVPEA